LPTIFYGGKTLEQSQKYLVELKSISKSFGKVNALNAVSFRVSYNETIGLIGDNGAGKSTLIKILTGVYPPDKGEIYIKGKKIKDYSTRRAREIGIETVYQEKALVEQHTLWRNIFIGREMVDRFGLLQINKQKRETEKLMREIGFTATGLSPESIVGALSGGEKEGVAISRVLYFKADLIILDEPTMALSLSEVKKVLDFVKEIKDRGKSCVFITHNVYHVYPVADRFVILDRGNIAGEFSKEDVSLDDLMSKLYTVARTGKISKSNPGKESKNA